LSKLAALDADATDAYLRLMELTAAAQDWPAVVQNAERFLAVNPLLAQPHRYLAQASEQTGQAPLAIASYRALLLLDPPDPAEVHFKLARLLQRSGDASAKRHVLQALEEAPRFREAHRLLLEINQRSTGAKQSPSFE
jgi:tetratricopeptide (TPR) repeat protein